EILAHPANEDPWFGSLPRRGLISQPRVSPALSLPSFGNSGQVRLLNGRYATLGMDASFSLSFASAYSSGILCHRFSASPTPAGTLERFHQPPPSAWKSAAVSA